jgi:hypothetical protein
MPDGEKPNKTTIAVGLLTVALGLMPVLTVLGILPRSETSSDPAPSWIGWMIGLAFVSAGVLVVMRELSGIGNDGRGLVPQSMPWPLRTACDVLIGVIIFSLAAIFTWIAFGPGPRHFSVSVGMFWTRTSGAGDTAGRVAFGVGALLSWLIAAMFVKDVARRWRG